MLHLALKAEIASRYASALQTEPVLSQDALTIFFLNGLVVEIRYLNINEYSIQWLWNEMLLRIDTAPIHPELASFPQHFHGINNSINPDSLTSPGQDPWLNVHTVLDALLDNPLLT